MSGWGLVPREELPLGSQGSLIERVWSVENAGVGFFIKTDHHGLADSYSGCPQIAGWSQHRLDGFVADAGACFEFGYFLAFGNDQFASRLGECLCFVTAEFA